MNSWIVIAVLLVAMGVAYQFGLVKSRSIAASTTPRMHSRPGYYGMLVALWCGIPALIAFSMWSLAEGQILRASVIGVLPAEMAELDSTELQPVMQRIEAIASGFGVADEPRAYEVKAAQRMTEVRQTGSLTVMALMSALAVAGLVLALRRIHPKLRARNHVETVISFLLIVCSSIAILTTVGIVLSMLGEAMHFFQYVSPADFFFGTTWNPRFSTVGSGEQGEFGLIPLLWGTIMVSAIALLVAVPTGLMTAIYMSEYATPRLRAVAKPVIEVLAGIPTIVYGFFALVTVGPFFSAMGELIGLDIRATSALTAGVVMGVMIIPFVSSLSDDIITQVPRAMRDGSYGLGATQSETVRNVILPAALPGIVGAVLLAASRAIGETMIVVLAAGNSPVLHANPFEAVSTVTVTIVNQLTGDTDFASPQSLVAFALGLTLFAITLALNVVALYIVRKYREQYE